MAFTLCFLAALAFGEDDGKYRHRELSPSTSYQRNFPVPTREPVYKYEDPRFGWSFDRNYESRRYDPRSEIDSRLEPVKPRTDTRLEPVNPRVDTRYDTKCMSNNYLILQKLFHLYFL